MFRCLEVGCPATPTHLLVIISSVRYRHWGPGSLFPAPPTWLATYPSSSQVWSQGLSSSLGLNQLDYPTRTWMRFPTHPASRSLHPGFLYTASPHHSPLVHTIPSRALQKKHNSSHETHETFYVPA